MEHKKLGLNFSILGRSFRARALHRIKNWFYFTGLRIATDSLEATTATVEWIDPNLDETKFEQFHILVKNMKNGEELGPFIHKENMASYELQSIDAYTDYEVTVQVETKLNFGTSEISDPLNFKTRPAIVTGIELYKFYIFWKSFIVYEVDTIIHN